MKKTITYPIFIIASLIIVLIFSTAKNYTQLAVAIITYPLLVYFALKIFPRKTSDKTTTIETPFKETRKEKKEVKHVDIVDIDKRAFLKLIGATGLSFFVFSILGRRVENLLFAGTQQGINQSSNQINNVGNVPSLSPYSGYRISEIDDNGTDSYYGFTNDNGGWLIMKSHIETNSFRYAKGDSGFPTNWNNRERLNYDYYYNLFKN